MDIFLSKLKKVQNMKFAVGDIEASEWINAFLVGFYDGEKYVVFKKVDDFLEYFLRRKYKGYKCFFHNGGRYDFSFIIEQLVINPKFNKNYSFSIIPMSGRILSIKINSNDSLNKWFIFDSFALLPKSLKELTYSFDVKNKKLETNYASISDTPETREYLKNDCLGLYQVLEKFKDVLNAYNIGLKPTIALQSLSAFRTTLKQSIPCLKRNVEDFIRAGYYGGRVEIYKIRAMDKTYCYDINSLYPFIMYRDFMPAGNPAKTFRFRKEAIGFYDVIINMPKTYIPILPHRINGKLIFPYGKFRGIHSSSELEMAKLMGAEYKIIKGYVFPKEILFKDYIEDMYKWRKSGDNTRSEIGKLLMNSLYGKFAMKRKRTSIFFTTDSVGMTPFNEEFALYSKETESKATFILPHLSAWITSMARIELAKIMCELKDESLFYCDTDSIFTSSHLHTGNKLGELKLVNEGKEAIFILPKLYAVKQKEGCYIKAKGFDRDFIKSLTYESFEKAIKGDYKEFNQKLTKFGLLKECLRRKGKFISMLEKSKSIKSYYDKRIILDNYDTEPIQIMS